MEENRADINKKIKLPLISYIFFSLGGFSLVIYITAVFCAPFADFFNRYVSSVFRGIFAAFTNILPLSLAELIIISLPVILFFIIRYALKNYTSSWRDVGVFCLTVLSLISLFFSVFVFNFGTGYYSSTLDQKLGLEKKEVSKEELAETALWLINEVNSMADEIEFAEKGSSITPHSLRETNGILLDSYSRLSNEYTFLPRLTSYVKPIMLSKPMTYTHIAGVYTYFTGEANVNTNCPDYSMPYTAAHELAHQRGIAREDEANFVAFLVCSESNDLYIRYCGYIGLCEYVLNSLYSADTKLWEETYSQLDNRVIYEMIAYNAFYEKYQDNVVGEISGTINDVYLQANGTEGTRSYGLVTDLAVAYYNKNVK